MALSLKHTFTSGKSDGPDSSLVQPSNWNAEHTFLMATNRLLGRTTAAAGAVEEIQVGSGLQLAAGSLSNPGTVPVGTVVSFAGASVPTGWLLCDGSAISRTTYALLFTAISTLYGVGNGSTTFNIPDIKGRVVVGRDDMGGAAANRVTAVGSNIAGTTLGATGGAQSVALSINQLTPHTHTGSTSTAADHTHSYDDERLSGGATTTGKILQNGSSYGGLIGSFTTGSAGAHNHTFTTASAGLGEGHNNMPPTLIMNMIIYAGV